MVAYQTIYVVIRYRLLCRGLDSFPCPDIKEISQLILAEFISSCPWMRKNPPFLSYCCCYFFVVVFSTKVTVYLVMLSAYTVHSRVFSPARSSPRRIVFEPPAIPRTCPPWTHCGSAYLGVLATGCKILILFVVSPSSRV